MAALGALDDARVSRARRDRHGLVAESQLAFPVGPHQHPMDADCLRQNISTVLGSVGIEPTTNRLFVLRFIGPPPNVP